MPHSQTFRLSTALGAAPGPEICIETRYDKGNNMEFIRWKDVEQVFSHAKYVLNGQVLVSFMVDDNFEDLEPKRIAHHPGVVLEVVTADSEKGSASLPIASICEATPPNSPLPDSVAILNDPNALQRTAGSVQTSDRGSDFVVFKETAGNDTLTDSDDEDEDEVPDLERVPLDDKPRQDRGNVHKETVEAKAGETWSEDDELDAEFALRYYLQRPGAELGHSHFFQGDFVRYIIILAGSKELKRLTLTTTVLTVASTLDATVVDPKVLKPIFNMIEFKDILMQEKASHVLTRLAAIDKNAELIVNNGGLRCLLHLGTSEVKTLRQDFSIIMVSLAQNEANAVRIASDKNIMAALLRLVQLDEIEMHENALSTISHLSNVEDARPKLVEAGVLPVIARLLGTPNPNFVLLILKALMNISKVAATLEWFVQSAPRIIRTLKELLEKNLDENSNEVLLLFLAQLASKETFQREIVSVGYLVPLLCLSRSSSSHLSALSASLVSRLAGPSSNDQPLIRSGWLERLIEMLDHDASVPLEDNKARCLIVSAFHRLLMRDSNAKPIMDKGLAKRLCSIAVKEPPNVQLMLACCLSSLARCVEIVPRLFKTGVLGIMMRLSASPHLMLKETCANAILNLCAGSSSVAPLLNHWTTPAPGFHGYFLRALDDPSIRDVAFMTFAALIEFPAIRALVAKSAQLRPSVLRVIESLKKVAVEKHIGPPPPTMNQFPATEMIQRVHLLLSQKT